MAERTPRDRWEKLEILARPIAAFVTAVAVAGIGWWAQSITQYAQIQESQRARQEQDYRLYTEILSRREESESSLRMNMFNTIIGEFFQNEARQANEALDPKQRMEDIQARVLKLETLALNFGDAISLRPLFVDLADFIEAMEPSEWGVYILEQDALRQRLESVARRVSSRQVSALATGGMTFDITIKVANVTGGRTYTWPDDDYQRDILDIPHTDNEADEELIPLNEWLEYQGLYELNGLERKFRFEFSVADPQLNTVDVSLYIQNPGRGPTEEEFTLNYFNFPMIDNTRLSSDQRFALVIESFRDDEIRVVGVWFPGLYATRKDRPFLDQIIEQLNKQDEHNGAENPEELDEE